MSRHVDADGAKHPAPATRLRHAMPQKTIWRRLLVQVDDFFGLVRVLAPVLERRHGLQLALDFKRHLAPTAEFERQPTTRNGGIAGLSGVITANHESLLVLQITKFIRPRRPCRPWP